jgi:hypothetical protein
MCGYALDHNTKYISAKVRVSGKSILYLVPKMLKRKVHLISSALSVSHPEHLHSIQICIAERVNAMHCV